MRNLIIVLIIKRWFLILRSLLEFNEEKQGLSIDGKFINGLVDDL